MKKGIHTLTELSAGDTIVVERWHTGASLADYWYKRPWRVEEIHNGSVRYIVTVLGLNKNNTSETVGYVKGLNEHMLRYGKIYKLTTKEDLDTWINEQRYKD